MIITITLWNDLADPAFDGVGLVSFESSANALFIVLVARSLFVNCFPFLFLSMGW